MTVIVAGTFGPLHDGHRRLFEAALRRADDRVIVGLTSDAFAAADRDRPVPPYEDRRRTVADAFERLDRWGRTVEITEIDDEYDVAAEDPTIDAIVVSTETEDRVAEINRLRAERGLDPLVAIVVPLLAAEDGERISSTRIGRGEIDEHGDLA